MKRHAAAAAAGLVVALAVAGPANASSDDAAITAAVTAISGGKHVVLSPGGPAIHVPALTAAIGVKPIFVVAHTSGSAAPSDWLPLIAAQTRLTGTYIVVDGKTISATSNTLDPKALQASRAAAVKAHPTDAVAALDAFVKALTSGAVSSAATAGPSPAAGPATAVAPPAKDASYSPLLLLLLVPILAGVAFAVTRARRRTG